MNEKIWLSKENNEKYNKGDPAVLQMTDKETNKFPKSIMIAGGISYYGIIDLLILEGTINEFSYSQAILHYKENVEELKKNSKILFEQDGASSHTSKSNEILLSKKLGETGWIQNPPNSPDLAYPIETLWANLKK